MTKLNFNIYLKYKLFNFISLILSLVVVGIIIYIAFWEFNILKEKAEIKPEIREISDEINRLSNLNIINEAEELKKKLPQPQVLSQPTITSEMVGKSNWFE